MKRFLKIVSILALFALVGAYVAFAAVFFDPFGSPRAALDPLVPKDIDFMFRRRDLAKDFIAFPMPRFFANMQLKDEWRALVRTSWFHDHAPVGAVESAFADLATLPAQLRPLDLMQDIAGSEVMVLGRYRTDGTLAWAAIVRGSFRTKLFAEALKLGVVRSSQGDLIRDYAEQDDVKSFTIAGNRWHLARSEDALIAGDDFDLVHEIRKLADSAELSLDESPQYRAEILMPSPIGRPVDFVVDVADVCKRKGIAWPAPDPNQEPMVRFLRDFLDPAKIGLTMGRLALGNQLELTTSATIDRPAMAGTAGGLLDGASVDLAQLWSFCGKVFPAKVAVAGYVRLDVKAFLHRVESLIDPDVRRLLNEEIVPNLKLKGGAYQPKTTVELLDRFAEVVGDELAFAFEPDEAYHMDVKDAPEGEIQYPDPRWGPRIALVFPVGDKQLAAQFISTFVDALRVRTREIPGCWTWDYSGYDDIKFTELKTIDSERPSFSLGVLELQKRPCVVVTTTGQFLNEIARQKIDVDEGRNAGLQTELQYRQAQEAISGFGQGFVFVSSERLRKVLDDYCVVFAEEATRPDWVTIRKNVERQVIAKKHPELVNRPLDEAARRKLEPEVDSEVEKLEVEWREQTLPQKTVALRADLEGLSIFRWLALVMKVSERELKLRLRLASPVNFSFDEFGGR